MDAESARPVSRVVRSEQEADFARWAEEQWVQPDPADDDAAAWVALEAQLDRGPDPVTFVDPCEVLPPGLGDPVSPVLFDHLACRVAGDVSDSALVAGLGAWQRFEGFTVSRQWVEIAELYARFTGPARARLERACAAGDESAAEEAADDLDLAVRSLVAEIAAVLSWSQSRAAGQVDIALVLTSTLTATLDAVAAGRIDVRRAEVIARALQREEGDLARQVEGEVLPGASDWNAPELRDRIKQSLLRAAPGLAARRAEQARKTRGVSFKAEPDDMVRMEALLPVQDGVRVQAALEVAAFDVKQAEHDARAERAGRAVRAGRGADDADVEVRCLAEIRADLLVDAILGLGDGLTPDTDTDADTGAGPGTPLDADGQAQRGTGSGQAGGSPTRADEGSAAAEPPTAGTTISKPPQKPPLEDRGRRVRRALRYEIVLTVPLETITGDADEPGFLSRYGPISADTARMLAFDVAADGYWRCAVTDGVHGTLLGLGRSTFTTAYVAPEFLQRFTNLRDRTCDFPGCRIPAAACDFDHTVAYPVGSTCECGGAKRCRNHHRLKHRTRWAVRRSENPDHPPGTQVWTSPTGREYTSRPAVIGVPAVPEPRTPTQTPTPTPTESGDPPY